MRILSFTILIVFGCSGGDSFQAARENVSNSANQECVGYKRIEDKVFLYDEEIKNADSKSFECIEHEYAKDKNRIYFGKTPFLKAHPQTFAVLQFGYSKDKNNVYYDYYSGKIISGADPNTFEVLNLDISKDKNFVYHFYKLEEIRILKNADAKSFVKLQNDFYKDKNFGFDAEGKIVYKIENSDQRTPILH
ncbi:DKNYY domain-containing protein [Leptospira barantonii]|uniref:DKNYY domain-containing protein n=1 Tax=Leptospira barantonii TaxID=2023184 RepID=UPI0013FD3D4C|nr:DKNYY domain-containing protein [Leptospira barantonii]